jgi:hypothetical protein
VYVSCDEIQTARLLGMLAVAVAAAARLRAYWRCGVVFV